MKKFNEKVAKARYTIASRELTKLINSDIRYVSKDDVSSDGHNISKYIFARKSWWLSEQYHSKNFQNKVSIIMINKKSKLYDILNLTYNLPDNKYYASRLGNDQLLYILPKNIVNDDVVKHNPFKFCRYLCDETDLSEIVKPLIKLHNKNIKSKKEQRNRQAEVNHKSTKIQYGKIILSKNNRLIISVIVIIFAFILLIVILMMCV